MAETLKQIQYKGRRKATVALIGRRFGMLVVTDVGSPAYVQVECDCGSPAKEVKPNELKRRARPTRSCGCQRWNGSSNRTHGQRKTRTYNVWSKMIGRCRNVNDEWHKKHYIDRGITVCERWQQFESFLADMGHAPDGLTLERKDNNKGYSPDNCKWATRQEQANNRRSNRPITANGETHTVADWSRITGRAVSTLHRRLNSGLFTDEQSVSSSRYLRREVGHA